MISVQKIFKVIPLFSYFVACFFEQFIMSILKVVILFLNYYLLLCFTLPAVNLHDF